MIVCDNIFNSILDSNIRISLLELQEQGLFEIKKRTEKVQVAALVQIWTGRKLFIDK